MTNNIYDKLVLNQRGIMNLGIALRHIGILGI